MDWLRLGRHAGGRSRLLLFILIGCLGSAVLWGAEAEAAAHKKLVFKDRFEFGLPSESSEHFLEAPNDLLMDKEQRLYVLDSSAKTVFVWGPDGTYLTNLGRAGEGPGEFIFRARSRSMLSYDGESVYVLDSDAGKIHLFRDLKFHNTIPKPNHFHLVVFMRHLKNGKILITQMEYRNKVPYSRMVLTDADFNVVKELQRFKDDTFKRNENGGWDYHAFTRRPMVHASYELDYFLISDTRSETVDIYDLDGNLTKKIKVPMPQNRLTEEKKQQLRDQVRWAKPPHRVFFPEYGERFTSFMPIGDQQVFVYLRDYHSGTLDGKIIDWQGKDLGVGHMTLGVEGKLDVFPSQLISIVEDEDGNFVVKAIQAAVQ